MQPLATKEDDHDRLFITIQCVASSQQPVGLPCPCIISTTKQSPDHCLLFKSPCNVLKESYYTAAFATNTHPCRHPSFQKGREKNLAPLRPGRTGVLYGIRLELLRYGRSFFSGFLFPWCFRRPHKTTREDDPAPASRTRSNKHKKGA